MYRKKVNGFRFGVHYSEYFDGISKDGAQLIFEGFLPAKHSIHIYQDYAVQMRDCYLYWVSTCEEDTAFTGPFAVTVRDPEVWWSKAKIQEYMDSLKKEFPRLVELECFGETTGHYPLNGIIAGNKDRLIACVGCIHAGESGPELILPAVRQLLERSPSLLEQVGIAALVSVNADQRERLAQGVPWYLRVNGNAVDLNRNFDALWDEIEYSYNFSTQWEYSPTYRGPFPESELEVLAVKNFITNTSPKAIFSYHALASVAEDRMLVAKECEEDRNFSEKCLRYMGAYSKAFRSFADSELTFDKPCIIYKATAGSLPSWAYHLGIPCFDLEYAGSAELKPSINGDTTEEMVKRCSQRHKEGLVAVIKEFLKEPL